MRFLRQSLIGLVLAAITLGLLGFAANIIRGAVQERMAQESRTPPARERVFAVGVVTAEQGTQTPTLEAFGQVQSRRTLELRASTSGRVIELATGFETGGAVRQGELLLRIDPADSQAALERASVDLAEAIADLADAERTLVIATDEMAAAEDQAALRQRAFERQRDLAKRGVGTEAAVEAAELAASAARQAVLARRQAVAQAQSRIDQARTQQARAQITVAQTERDVADTTLFAPFTGNLSATTVVEGRLVSANEKLAELIDPTALEVSLRISTAQYARLIDADGALIRAPVTASLDVAGVDLAARGAISRASPDAGIDRSGRLVFATLDDAPGFKPGDFVTVAIEEPPLENVVRLPAAAYDPAGSVLVLGEGDRLERLNVDLVRRQGNDVLLRGDGLAGREVVEALSPLLGSGIQVRPLRRDAPPDVPEMIELSEERRAKLVAFVEANTRMPQAAKDRVLAQLAKAKVPAQMLARLESRMGG